MWAIQFYVPKTHAEAVKKAMFAKGAGRIGNYDSCAWQSEGIGQFRPLEGSTPHLGQINQVEQVAEFKVEMVCEEALIQNVIQALKEAHPYEEPAYLVLKSEVF